MRLGKRSVTLGALVAVLLAVALDRASLWLWDSRVHSLFEALKAEAQLSDEQRHAAWSEGRWYTLSLSLTPPPPEVAKRYPIPFTEVALDRPDGLRPSIVTVDGLGGLHLRFFPPWAAWSVPLRMLLVDTNEPFWMRRYAHSYSIDIQWYGESTKGPRPEHALVRLEYGAPGSI